MYGRPGAARARRALHDSVLPLLHSSQSHPVLLTHGVSRPGPQGLCFREPFALLVCWQTQLIKAVFSVLAGVRILLH